MPKSIVNCLIGVFAIIGIYFGFKAGVYIQHNFPLLATLLGDTPDPMTVGTRLDTSGTLPLVTALLGFIIVGGGYGMFLEKIFPPAKTESQSK